MQNVNDDSCILTNLVDNAIKISKKEYTFLGVIGKIYSLCSAGFGMLTVYPATYAYVKDREPIVVFCAVTSGLFSTFVIFCYFNGDIYNKFVISQNSILKETHAIAPNTISWKVKLCLFLFGTASAIPLAIPFQDETALLINGPCYILTQLINLSAINIFSFNEIFCCLKQFFHKPFESQQMQRQLIQDFKNQIFSFFLAEQNLERKQYDIQILNAFQQNNAELITKRFLNYAFTNAEMNLPIPTSYHYYFSQFIMHLIIQTTNIGMLDNAIRGFMGWGINKNTAIFVSTLTIFPLYILSSYISKTNLDLSYSAYNSLSSVQRFNNSLSLSIRIYPVSSAILASILFLMVLWSWIPILELFEIATQIPYPNGDKPIFDFLSPINSLFKALCIIGTIWYNIFPVPYTVASFSNYLATSVLPLLKRLYHCNHYQELPNEDNTTDRIRLINAMSTVTDELEQIDETSFHKIIAANLAVNPLHIDEIHPEKRNMYHFFSQTSPSRAVSIEMVATNAPT